MHSRSALTIQDGQDILAQKEVDQQLKQKERRSGSHRVNGQPTLRQCGKCGKRGHDLRICQKDLDPSDKPNS